MPRKLVIALFAVLVAIPTVYFGSGLLYSSTTQQDLGDVAEETAINQCENIKESACLTGNVSRSDYGDSCFEDGEHILDDPYQCSS